MFRLFLSILVISAFLAVGCGPRKVGPKPARPPAKTAQKVPASQRPYTINGRTYYPISSSHGYKAEGIASWYGRKFHGR